jgi:hypothetical protein
MHVIRLRAPWEVEALAKPPGTVRCVRNFNKPTGLDGGEHVWLVVDGPVLPARIALNGQTVVQASGSSPGGALTRSDITSLLAARNKIEIELVTPEGGDPLVSLGDVRLEIDVAQA